MFADATKPYIKISRLSEMPGESIVEAHCDRIKYDSMPRTITFEGRIYGLSEWNKQRGVAVYRTSAISKPCRNFSDEE